MKSDEEMAALARAFYDAYIEAKGEEPGAKIDVLQAQFHGVHAAAAAFMGALIGDFYHESPWTRFVFFSGIALKSIPLGGVGVYHGVWTRQEAVDAWNACGKALVGSPEFFLQDANEEDET